MQKTEGYKLNLLSESLYKLPMSNGKCGLGDIRTFMKFFFINTVVTALTASQLH